MFSWPLPKSLPGWSRSISSPFGPRINPVTQEQQNHGGLDLPTPVGSTVRAVAPGTVGTVVYDHPVAGHYVEVDHGGGYWSRYLHLSDIQVRKGDRLSLGGKVGLSGGGVGIPGAGRTTGPHLHLEIWRGGQPYKGGKPIDPMSMLTSELPAKLWGLAKDYGRRGAAALRRNWWIAASVLVVGGGIAIFLLTAKKKKQKRLAAAATIRTNRKHRARRSR